MERRCTRGTPIEDASWNSIGIVVVRVTFMHRFSERLYVGFHNNERRARWDLGVLEGTPSAEASLVFGRVTDEGGWKPRQFASDDSHLYWSLCSVRGWVVPEDRLTGWSTSHSLVVIST
jgi:hypothetical protein